MNVSEFAKQNAITISSVPAPLRENEKSGFRYKVKIHYAGKAVPVDYFCGSAYVGIPRSVPTGEVNGNGMPVYKKEWRMLTQKELQQYEKNFFSSKAGPIPPQLESVLECLLCDYCLLESAPFWPEYANETEMNVDSIKDRAIYDDSVNQFMAFRKMLGYQKTQEFLRCDRD